MATTTSAESPSRTTTDAMSSSNNNQNIPLSSNEFEEVLMELTRFEKSPTPNIPTLLERYLISVAKTGNANFPWSKVKPLFRTKLENVISALCPTDDIPPAPNVDVFNFQAIKNKVFEQLDSFAGIPFTVQRLAELLTSPRRHYKRTDKFMRALEKNMLIVSTVEARQNNNHDSSNNYFMNGDFLSNGNLSSESNGSTSPELSSKPLEPPMHDNIEDELDAEMPEVPTPNTVTSDSTPPQEDIHPEIEDEMVNETSQNEAGEPDEAVGSSSEDQTKTAAQRSDQVEKVSGSEENQASQSSVEPVASITEAMEFDDTVESSSDSTTTESKVQNNSSENDETENECNNDTPMTTVAPSSSSDEAVEAVEETNPEESNEATACSTSEQPHEETEEVTKDEEKVNSSCETLTKLQDDVSEPGSTEDTAASSEVVESTD